MKKFYLSPSSQATNAYVVGGTTEKIQMEDLCKQIKDKMNEQYDVECIVATSSLSVVNRVKEAKNLGCEFFLAVHSNAGGGKATGTVFLYHPNAIIAVTLGTALINSLNVICPIKSNRSSQLQNGMAQYNGVGINEVREPMLQGIPSSAIEVNFHDNIDTANWLINSKPAIAQAMAVAIAEVMGYAKKIIAPPAVPIVNTGDIVYIVVSGDNLSTIATRYNTTYQKLAAYNGISNPSLINVGQKIKIPQVTSPSTVSILPTTTAAPPTPLIVGDNVMAKGMFYAQATGTGTSGNTKGYKGKIKYISKGKAYPINIDGRGWFRLVDVTKI